MNCLYFYVIVYWDGERWGLGGVAGDERGGGGGVHTMIARLFSELGKYREKMKGREREI